MNEIERLRDIVATQDAELKRLRGIVVQMNSIIQNSGVGGSQFRYACGKAAASCHGKPSIEFDWARY